MHDVGERFCSRGGGMQLECSIEGVCKSGEVGSVVILLDVVTASEIIEIRFYKVPP